MNPYLSIVCGVGGNLTRDLLFRLQDSVANSHLLARDSGLDVEIIVVEWNLQESIGHRLPCLGNVRVIHAGHVHATIPNPNKLAYHEMRPKNIGIRRAHGEYVLSTNPDDLFTKELFEFFARRELQHGHFYRINRYDTKDGKVFRVCHPTGCYPPDAPEAEIRKPRPGAAKWAENMLHYNAAGDFVLMAKDEWFKIHGNPERDWNHTVDGETVWLAHQHGLKQVVLPYPMFHPDHERTLNINTEGKIVAPMWDDARPHATENGEGWGCAGMEFEETIL